MNLYTLAADLVALVHFAYVAFVVVGLLLVWIGYLLEWRFVRSILFRSLHIFSMAIVVAESLLNITCPLTTWEHQLRVRAGEGGGPEASFIAHWVHRLMFFELEPSTFTVIYVIFFVVLVLSFIVVPPRRRSRNEAR